MVIPNEPDGYPPICTPPPAASRLAAHHALQFHKFSPLRSRRAVKLIEEQYVALIRHICRIPTWWPGSSEKYKLVVPGYKNLRDFSAARQFAFQQNIGWWLITYFRIGNWRMIYPSPKLTREWAVENITNGIDHGDLQAVFMSVFPRMNHCVIAYDYDRSRERQHRLLGLRSRTTTTPSAPFEWDAKERDFSPGAETLVLPFGGHVKLLRMYISPIH